MKFLPEREYGLLEMYLPITPIVTPDILTETV